MAAGVACKQSGKVNRIFNKQFRVGAGTIIPEWRRDDLYARRASLQTLFNSGQEEDPRERGAIINFAPVNLHRLDGKKKGRERKGGEGGREGKHGLPRLRKYPSRASINIPFFPSIRSLTKADERMGKKKKKRKK